ncbi:metallophosphoesterase [Bdellovibrio bacteriovorus]
MAIFRTVAASFILGIFIYVSHQLTGYTDFSWPKRSLLISFLALLFTLVIGTFLFFWKEKDLDHKPWRDTLLNFSLTVMGYINFLVTLVLLRDVFALADNLFGLLNVQELYSSTATGYLLGLPVLMLALGNTVVKVGPKLKKVPLYFKNLPAEFDNLRIVHITDLHVSPSLPKKFVKKLVNKTLELKPDVIVFTGDILDSFAEKHQEELKTLGRLKAAHGVYYVPGNHEYYWGAEKGLTAFRDIGFNVLINEVTAIRKDGKSLQIAGIPDPAATHFGQTGPDFIKVQSQLKPDDFKILLSHQPSLASKSAMIGIDLQLSGHTHGGQFFPWNWLIVFFERYAKGLYRINGMQLYVNQGTGYWGPRLRLGTYCELTEIVLRKESKTE